MGKLSKFAIPRKCKIPEGAYGVWQVPELDIIIPLYWGNNATAQAIVDTEFAACIEPFGVGKVINDHADSETIGSGLWNVCDFRPDTAAFLVQEKTTTCYTCKFVCRAYRHTHAYIMDGQSIYPRSAIEVLCVSCATPDASEVYIATFKKTGELPT